MLERDLLKSSFSVRGFMVICARFALVSMSLLSLLLSALPARAELALDERELGVSTGYRIDKVQWSISGNPAGTSPNVLSELTWKDLEIYQLQHFGRLQFKNESDTKLRTEISWRVGYGQITDGKNRDSDYGGDNRTLEWSRSNNNGGGSVFDLSLGLGFKYFLPAADSWLMPQFGLSLHRQNLEMTNGYQTLTDQAVFDAWAGQSPGDPGYKVLPSVGPFAGLDSSYDAEWRGPWVGLSGQLRFAKRARLGGGVEYHRTDFEAEANWNLRSDLAHPVSFRHDGDGEGMVYRLHLGWQLAGPWQLNFDGRYQDWRVENGLDTAFGSTGSVGVTRLREVTWESYETMVGISRRF